MKSSKKTIAVIAVTLLLAAALFVGAGAADDTAATEPTGYWHVEGATAAAAAEAATPGSQYTLIKTSDSTTETPKYSEVKVHTAEGLGWVAGELMKTDGVFKDSLGLTVTFDKPSYDMDAHLWLPLSTHKITVTADQEGKGTATAGDPIPAMNGIKFKGENGATIQYLHIVNTLLYSGSEDTGGNNNYGSGFIGRIFNVSGGVSFENLTFKNADVSPGSTYGLNPELYDPKGYNHIGAVIGYAGYTPVTFNNVTVADSTINGSSKVGAFVGYAPGCGVTFTGACKVSGNTIVTGFDGVGKLIGFADTKDPVIGADTEIESGVKAEIKIWPEASESYLDREVLGYIGTDGNVHELWTLKDGIWVLNQAQVPAADAVVDVIKGDDYNIKTEEFTKAKIRAAKADLYTMMGNYGAKQISIYGKSVSAPVQSASVDYVAEIDGNKYPTLKAAIDAVPADGTATTITMLKDYAFEGNAGVEISANKKIILDLNGHKISCSATVVGTSAVIRNIGDLTIKDSTADSVTKVGTGLIVNGLIDPAKGDAKPIPGYATNVIRNQGTLTLESGVLQNVADGLACYAIDADSQSDTVSVSTTINGGKLVAVKTPLRFYCSADRPNTMVINDGTITGGRYGVSFQTENNTATCSLTIKGGTITGKDVALNVWCVSGTNKTLTIAGGTFTQEICFANASLGSYSITGGNFKSINVAAGVTMSNFITGGIFDTKPADDYIASGYKWDPATKEVVTNVPTKEQKDVDPVKKEADIKPESPAEGEPEETIISEISDGTDGRVVDKIAYAPSAAKIEDVMPTKVSRTVAAVYLVPIDEDGKAITTLKSEATLAIKVDVSELSPEQIKNLAVYHGNTDGSWNELTIINKSEKSADNKITLTVRTKYFSPFAVVVKNPSSAPSRSSSQGSSVWLTEPTAQPTVTPTPTPTPGAVETPSVKPIETPSGSSAKTPAPFLGILAGLGAAGVLFGLRRK